MNSIATWFVREKLLQQIFVELNNFTELLPSVDIVLKYLKILTSCSSVGIRLKKNNEGAPYYTYNGFSKEFIEHENDICLYSLDNKHVINADGTCILQCMCGVVLNINIENKNVLNSNGSFWTNNSTTLLSNISSEDKQTLSIREYCNACGYESIALIPIVSDGEVIGLLQINDKETNKFDEEIIAYLETVGIQLGLSIKNRNIYSDLLNKYNKLLATCT